MPCSCLSLNSQLRELSEFLIGLIEIVTYFSESKFKYSKDCVPNTVLTEMPSTKYLKGFSLI